MITATFSRRGNTVTEFSVTGHAQYAPYGEDIVCASVTSAVQTVLNGITQVLGEPAEVKAEENLIRCTLPQQAQSEAAQAFLEALCLQLGLLSEDYPENVTIVNLEV